jgi:hypothetical protein
MSLSLWIGVCVGPVLPRAASGSPHSINHQSRGPTQKGAHSLFSGEKRGSHVPPACNSGRISSVQCWSQVQFRCSRVSERHYVSHGIPCQEKNYSSPEVAQARNGIQNKHVVRGVLSCRAAIEASNNTNCVRGVPWFYDRRQSWPEESPTFKVEY